MSSLSTSLYGSTTNKGVGGLLSGLDTDELVKQMTAATRNKISRQYQSKQKLLYRQEAYREISTKLLSFSNKYFSYSSGSKTNILSPSFFKSYTFKSSSNYVNVSGNAENIKNFSIDSITSVATAASFTSSKRVTSGKVESANNITDYISSLAGETMTLGCEGKTYNITLDSDFGKVLKDINGDVRTGEDAKIVLQDVVDELNEQLAKIEGNESFQLFKCELNDGTKIEIKSTDENKSVILAAASNDIINYLNLKTGQAPLSTDAIDLSKLTLSKESILYNDESYFTFEFNGVTKKINLSENFGTALEIENYLKGELNSAFGEGKVTVNYDGAKFSFAASNDTDIFGVSSISKDLSNLIEIESGDYNRLNKTKTLEELGFSSDNYQIKINDAIIDIKNTMTMTDVINTINSNATAGVKVYYSSTTDTFTVKATETGVHKGIAIVDMNGGNLAKALFGSSVNSDLREGEYLKVDSDNDLNISYKVYDENDIVIGTAVYDKTNKQYSIDYYDPLVDDIINKPADYIVKSGTDTEMTYTLNGVQNTITRSTANFKIDEINIELNEKASTIDFTNNVTFDVTNNSDEVVERVKQFINDYNEIINLIGTKTSEKPKRDYAPLTPEQQDDMEEDEIKSWTEEAKKGVLFGDRKMSTLLNSMRSSMSGLTDVSSLTLSSIGISSASMDTTGKLVLDETKFKEKLLENPDEIANLFTATTSSTATDSRSGISLQIQSILRQNVGTYGTTGLLIDEAGLANSMTSDRNYISEKIEEYDDKMAELKKDLEVERQRYWKQFSALESSLNRLNMQSSWLTDMSGQ